MLIKFVLSLTYQIFAIRRGFAIKMIINNFYMKRNVQKSLARIIFNSTT